MLRSIDDDWAVEMIEVDKVDCSTTRFWRLLSSTLLFIAEDWLLFKLMSWELADRDADVSREKRKHCLSTSGEGVNSSEIEGKSF